MQVARKRSPNEQIPGYLLYNHARSLQDLGRFEAARTGYETLLTSMRGAGNVRFELAALNGLAGVAWHTDSPSRTQAWLDEGSALIKQHKLDAANPIVANQRTIQTQTWQSQGRHEEALRSISDVLDGMNRKGLKVAAVALRHAIRAQLLAALGRQREAIAEARHALTVAQQTQGKSPHSSVTGQTSLELAKILRDAGQNQEARQIIAEALSHLRATVDEGNPYLVEAAQLAQAIGL